MSNNISIDCFDSYICIRWKGGGSDIIKLSLLRKVCPCAFCSGESDVFGNVYAGEKKEFSSQAFVLKSYSFVGLYGVRFVWGDGHSDGIFTFKNLKLLCKNDEK